MQANARVVIGDITAPEAWQEAGLEHARSVGVLGSDDMENLTAALLVADESRDVAIVTRLFSRDLAAGMEQLLGSRKDDEGVTESSEAAEEAPAKPKRTRKPKQDEEAA